MKINKYGINLKSLGYDHLEELRKWRNSDFVKSCMFYQKKITEEDQIKWFDKICKENKNKFFIISINSEKLGCCNLHLNTNKLGVHYAEGGIFFKDTISAGSLHAHKAIFILYDWGFSNYPIEYIYAQIRTDNKRAIRFNKSLGFKVTEENSDKTEMLLSREDFGHYLQQFKNLIER